MNRLIGTFLTFFLLFLCLITPSCRKAFVREQEPILILFEERHQPAIVEEHNSQILLLQMEDFTQQLTDLFGLHAVLISDAIEAAYFDASQEVMEAMELNLFNNAHEIASLLAIVYGSPIAHRFECLFKHHIKLGTQYIRAIKAQDCCYAHHISRYALANGDMLVEFLNIINPFFAHEPERLMFEERVNIEARQTVAYFEGWSEKAEELKEYSFEQAKEMAEHLAKAIERQLVSELNSCAYDSSLENCPEEE